MFIDGVASLLNSSAQSDNAPPISLRAEMLNRRICRYKHSAATQLFFLTDPQTRGVKDLEAESPPGK